MKNKLIEMGLIVGIVIIFIISSVTPVVIGYKFETTKDDPELKKMLDDLRFMCIDANGFSEGRYKYYKEKFLSLYESDNSNDDMIAKAEKEDSKIPVVSLPATMVGGPKDTPWPMKCHDNHHTSQSPYSTANVDGLEKWRVGGTDGWVEGGPAIDSDGTIYYGDLNRYFYALYPDGSLKWEYKTGGWIFSVPAIGEDNTIYFGSWDDYLYAINPDGTLKWKCVSGDGISSSPAIGEDGSIYYGTLDGKIQAVYSNGTIKWVYQTGSNIYSDPAIGDDGTIYIGSNDKYLYAMNPNGTLKWRFKTGTAVGGSPSIADDGTIYAYGTWDNYLYALYPNNGTIKWKCNIKVNSNPSIGSDGTIYIGGDEKLYAVYPNGTRKWTFKMGSERWVAGSCPAISSDGTIYIGTNIGNMEGGEIIAVNPDGTEQWRKNIGHWVDSSPCIAEDGTVYIGSADWGYLHAFGPVESNEPPDTPTISGETKGWAGRSYWYNFKSIDPDRNPISFYIDWGDETNTGWTSERASGENCYYEHAWSEWDEYTIRCKAKDVMGEESDWGELTVTMPRNRATYNSLFYRFLEQFPILQKILNLII